MKVIIGKILVAEGTENVPVNDVIAVLLEDGESADDIGDVSAAPAPKEAPKEEAKVEAAPAAAKPPVQNETPKGDRIFASPLAKRVAANKGIDLSNIKGSGPRGRIVKADVENAKPGQAQSPAAAAQNLPEDVQLNVFGMPYREIPNNNIKKITAKRLTESKQDVPHFYLTVECELDNLLASRKELNEAANGEFKLSVNDFIIKASAMALKSYPAANVSWTGNHAVHQYLALRYICGGGNAQWLDHTDHQAVQKRKGLREISDEMKELAGRAREGKLKPEEFQGGSFSISNLGMFGVKNFQAIINPPQSCILAVGAGEQMPKIVNGEVKVKTVMNVTLSTDHRSVDGAIGAEWLQHFKRYIENPVSMLL